MKTILTLLNALKDVALLAHRVSELERELKAVRAELSGLREHADTETRDVDRRVLRIEHFIEFANRLQHRVF